MTEIATALTISHAAIPPAIAAPATTVSPPTPTASPPPTPRTGPLRSGNPRGNPNLAPRCGAKARTTGCPCRAPAMQNGRCRMHGGTSTGPRTTEGLARLARARTTHGNTTAEARAAHRHIRTMVIRSRVLCAAMDLHAYLPSAIRTRFDLGADDLAAPPYPTRPPDTAAASTHPRHPARDAHGRFAASPKPAPRGQQAEREAACAERAMLAPWRAGIKRARMIRRLLTLQAQNARHAQPGQHATADRPVPLPRHGAAPNAHFPLARRKAMQREPTQCPAVQTENPDKTPIQRGAGAYPLGLTAAPTQAADKTPLQRGTVPPAQPNAVTDQTANPPPKRPGATMHPSRPSSADHQLPDKTLQRGTGARAAPIPTAPPAALMQAPATLAARAPTHPATVRPSQNPFRRALLAGTVCNMPDADGLAARAGDWPVMRACARDTE